ncbi:MAG: hypothetical protein JWO30_637 [Fibrobacteres bacterium]|nr:hypothetical protein [Fibrobacterota bacterium]
MQGRPTVYEHFYQPILPTREFFKRLARHGGFASAFLLFSLALGMLGYHALAGLSWIDSFVNASMILTGMGPVTQMVTWGSKLFSGLYALYSGIAFLSAVGIFFAPILHRTLHHFHLER